jgi:hypothetical protein
MPSPRTSSKAAKKQAGNAKAKGGAAVQEEKAKAEARRLPVIKLSRFSDPKDNGFVRALFFASLKKYSQAQDKDQNRTLNEICQSIKAALDQRVSG